MPSFFRECFFFSFCLCLSLSLPLSLLTCAPVSRTQINLSDSMVVLVNVTNCASTPMAGSCFFLGVVGVEVDEKKKERAVREKREGKKKNNRGSCPAPVLSFEMEEPFPFSWPFQHALTPMHHFSRACDVSASVSSCARENEGTDAR